MSWKLTTLRAVAEVALGRQRAPQHESGSHIVPYLRAANVKDGSLDLNDVLEMNFTPKEQQVFALEPGDLLMTEGSGSRSIVGASAVWRGEIEGIICFQNTLLRLRSRSGSMDGRFLAWWARGARESGLLASIAGGANIYHLSADRVRQLPIKLPPLGEQRIIADFLDAQNRIFEQVARSRRRQKELLELRRKTIVDGAVRQAGPANFKLFRALRTLRDGSHQPPPRVSVGVPLLTARNVSTGVLRLTEFDTHVSEDDARELERSLKLVAGDVLLSVKGTIGAVALTPSDFPRAVLDRNVALLRSGPRLLPEWLSAALRSTQLQDQMRIAISFAAQPGLPLGVIRELRLPLPPVEVQRLLARMIEQEEGQMARLERAIARHLYLLSEHRKALIVAATTGQIDVTTARGVTV
ncbi:restriction endonuclease subunit S [Micromonospora haikouensis]|uniref:restriction endonuclease subunit S n=1 Tax=Micromonospora haikouensis TaxID=686309 RepID=UPI003675EBD8